MDTVVEGPGWTRDPFAAEEEDGKIYGRGACDMKAGLACALVVFREIAENVKHGKMRLKYPLKLLCTVDEEGTMRGAERAVLSGRVSKDDWVLDMEPTGCLLYTSPGLIGRWFQRQPDCHASFFHILQGR